MNQVKKTFEESMARLEQIVRAMERGDVALEESLKLFQEGTELVRSCGKLLDEAELQVSKITTAADGSPVHAAARRGRGLRRSGPWRPPVLWERAFRRGPDSLRPDRRRSAP